MQENGFEISWRMFLSPKILLAYFVCGLVWLSITLPNLLESAEYKTGKALMISAWRVIAWPYLFGMEVKSFLTQPKEIPDDEVEHG